jgi:hypothetical protein
MLTISNIYGHGFDAQQVARLEALGFRMRPEISHYAGSQLCRFIDFETGPALEIIEVEDQADYQAFVPDGMVPYCPGISLLLPDESGVTLDDYERKFRHLDPYTLHINYDGSQDTTGPGWNYLNFGTPPVADTFIWLTALDQPRPQEQHETAHPNGVTGLAGLVFDLDVEALKGLAHLVQGEFSGGALTIDTVQGWPRNRLADCPAPAEKTFPLTTIVLKAPDLDTFAAHRDRVQACSFMARRAIRIVTNCLSWDLMVVEDR